MISASISRKNGVQCVINSMPILSISSTDMLNPNGTVDFSIDLSTESTPIEGSIWLTSVEVTSDQELIPFKTNLIEDYHQVFEYIKNSPFEFIQIIQIANANLPEEFLLKLEKLARCTVAPGNTTTTAYKTLIFRRGVALWMSNTGEELQMLINCTNIKDQVSKSRSKDGDTSLKQHHSKSTLLAGPIQESVMCNVSTYNVVSLH
jgi:hypothetical protein